MSLFAAPALVAFVLAAGPASEPVSRLDRMWAVGKPPLDTAESGLYIWVADGAFQFAAVPVGDGRKRVVQWTLRATEPLRLRPDGDCRIAAKSGRQGLILAARPVRVVARCAVETEGELTLTRVRSGRKAGRAFVGPRARPTHRQLRLGRY